MLALPRVGMLVEVRAVELGQPVRILGEVRRHPIENHADPGLVAVVDEVPELVRISEAAGRRVIAGNLISP